MPDLDHAQTPLQLLQWWEGWLGQPLTPEQQDVLLHEFEHAPPDATRSILRRWRHDRPDPPELARLIRDERLRRAPNPAPFKEAAQAAQASNEAVAKQLDWRTDEELEQLRAEVLKDHPSKPFMERSSPRTSAPLRALIYAHLTGKAS